MGTGSTGRDANDSEERNGSIEATERALEELQGRIDAGEDVDEAEFVRQHPELNEEIAMIFEWLGNARRQRVESQGEARNDSNLFGCPRVLGDFRIIRHIGSGGMANVYEAEQIRLKRRVALKVLAPQLTLSEKAILKFKREAEAAGRQNHPGIIAIFDVGEQEGFYYIAAELVDGERTLADRLDELREAGDLPRGYFREIAELIARAASALQHAHDSSVIHRDVKPSNILIGPDGQPKISDFGLAKVEDALALSRSGDFAGTPYYVSPEQVVPGRKGIDHRTDIFSLGVTLYEALTLERPFEAETAHQILRKIQLHDARDLQRIDARLPRALSLICRKAMEKDPARRYQTMAEFAGELRRFLAGESILTRPAGLWRRGLSLLGRYKLASVTLSALFLAALSLAILAFVLSGQQEREFQLAQSRYILAGEAMELGVTFTTMCRWCLEADLRDPSGDMALAICHLESQVYDDAIASLDACVAKSRQGNFGAMEREAHYLLAVARYRKAETLDPDSREGKLLTARAEENLERSGDFDPLSSRTLVWRHWKNRPFDGSDQPWYQEPLRVNNEHYLADLCAGLTLFRELHLGGDSTSFDKAIRHFENVLGERPENVVALTFLGRVYFFYARHYNTLHLLKKSRELLDEALRLSGTRPYPMIATTLGQVALLAGDDQSAAESFDDARRAGALRDGGDINVHNVRKGFGMVCARQGNFDEAFRWIDEGLNSMPADPPLHVARALLSIETHDLDGAITSAMTAKDRRFRDTGLLKKPTYYAPAFLVSALAHVMKKDYAEAINDLWRLANASIKSPRHQSLACLLIATFPPAVMESSEFKNGARTTLLKLARSATFAYDDQTSPAIFSALGALALIEGDFHKAIGSFEKALRTRERLWPASVREFHWSDRARDLYFLAIAHRGLANSDPEEGGAERRANSRLAEAEEIFSRSRRPIDEGGLVDMVRHRARVVFGLERETSGSEYSDH